MHKQCKNNAKPIPKKNAQKTQKQVTKGCLGMPKKRKTNAKKTHVSTKPMQKTHKKCKKNAQKRHKKCKNNAQKMQKNAIKKQNECDQKRSGLCLCILFALYLRFFCDFFAFFVRFLEKTQKKSKKTQKKMQKKCKKIAKKMQKKSHKKGGV